MSKRENIANNIVRTLAAMSVPRLGRVTREPIVIAELSRQALPAVYVESADESREQLTAGNGRMGTITYNLNIVVSSDTRDSDRNIIIEGIEEALEVDVRRDGNALDGEVTDVEIIEIGEAVPYASMRLVYQVMYRYERGAA